MSNIDGLDFEEGASAPTPPPWRCGHPASFHTREGAAVCWYAQQGALAPAPSEASAVAPSFLSMTAALWNGYLKAISVSRGPALLLSDRDVLAMEELREIASRASQ